MCVRERERERERERARARASTRTEFFVLTIMAKGLSELGVERLEIEEVSLDWCFVFVVYGPVLGVEHTSAYISIRHPGISQHMSAYVSRRQHTSAYVSIRQHTSAYVSRGG